MKKTTIKLSLPSQDELLEGLDLHAVHPKLARAEKAAADAEQGLEGARDDLAALEQEAEQLPFEIQRGIASTGQLEEKLRQVDSAALKLPASERALAEARDRLEAEQKRARAKLEAEVARRRKQLERAVAELVPVLEQLKALDQALAQTLKPTLVGFPGVDWPLSNIGELRRWEYAEAMAQAEKKSKAS